jgi:hypothetical protein
VVLSLKVVLGLQLEVSMERISLSTA